MPEFSCKGTTRVAVCGFFVEPSNWDDHHALEKALEMGVPGGLSGKPIDILVSLRECCEREGRVPSVYETCRRNGIGLEELEKPFPHGYRRRTVKLAGLRVR